MAGEPDLDVALDAADCVIIVTDHSIYDWRDIARRMSCLVDTRHVTRA
jgi:UDP-N-acetyl-D-glucosamine dehydrogenase